MKGASSNGEGDSCEILIKDIEEMIKNLELPTSPDCSIYRVPNNLRKLNEEVYTPMVVSIGPFHHGEKKELKPMENFKLRCVEKIRQRTGITIRELVDAVKRREDRIRGCYEGIINKSSNVLTKIILVDAVFIIVCIVQVYYDSKGGHDAVLEKNFQLPPDLFRDFILLENQLPFFALEDLYDLIFRSRPNHNHPPFLEIVCLFFGYFNSQKVIIRRKVEHFTDLIWAFTTQSFSNLSLEKGKTVSRNLHSVAELQEAGVRIEVSPNTNLLDIKFRKGVLKIPQFRLEDITESLIRNLMALEQCHYEENMYVCDYMSLMDELIKTARDVDLLVEKGILVNWLGDSTAPVTLVNKLCINVTLNQYTSYAKLWRDLKAYYDQPWHGWRATLKHEYFTTPWRECYGFPDLCNLLPGI
ncbi:UPF0481 protein At3g47200-like isoform X2 [Carica papaya]|uniref:UPF0481 protein At3g47200-like isoform X2 n=1 Tax=Carica papaya TaxID=3649 RepID=UPI000B8C98E0|nr:UPF0481 protein At3g47200-like isoform X2 [Carica papaya]